MKTHGIRLRILIPLMVTLLAILTCATMGFLQFSRQRTIEDLQTRINSIQPVFNADLDKDARLMNGLIDFLAKDECLQQAWLVKDRQRLLRCATSIFENIRPKYRVTHFYFHGLDRVNFLRVHNPPRHGDVIDRITLQSAEKNGKSFHGVELGPFGTFTLRVVQPWWINGELSGYIELGEEIEHIIPWLSDISGMALLAIIEKRYLDRAKWEEGRRMMGRVSNWNQYQDYVLIEGTEIPVSLELPQHITLVHHEQQSLFFNFLSGNRGYLGGFIPLNDAAGNDVGDIVALLDITDQTAETQQTVIYLTAIMAGAAAALFTFFWFFLGRIQQNLNVTQRDLKEKTREHRQAERRFKANEQTLLKEARQRKAAEKNLALQVTTLQRTQKAAVNTIEDANAATREHEETGMQPKHALESANVPTKQAKAASGAKSEFLAGMSDEIRTPMNGGEPGMESRPGAGGTFQFAQELPRAAEEPVSQALNLAPPPTDSSRLGGRVLLAEDNPVNREVAEEMLALAGCGVTAAAGGWEALSVFAAQPFDLVLMDLHMPDLDGFATTAAIRQLERERGSVRVPVVALTADVLQGTRERCRTADMDGYLSKPLTLEQLYSVLGGWLPPQRSPVAQASAAAAEPTGPDPIIDQQPLDQIRAMHRPGKPNLLERIIGLYRQSSPALVQEIRSCIDRDDAEGLRDAAHSLKSASANLGAKRLGALCKTLEELGQNGDIGKASGLLDELEAGYSAVREALSQEIEKAAET